MVRTGATAGSGRRSTIYCQARLAEAMQNSSFCPAKSVWSTQSGVGQCLYDDQEDRARMASRSIQALNDLGCCRVRADEQSAGWRRA